MKWDARLIGIIGGVVGATAAGLAVAGVVQSQRRQVAGADQVEDPYTAEPLGRLKPDRTRTVAADDGVPLSVEEVDPADGGRPELTVILVHGFALSRRCWHFQRRDLAAGTDPRVRLVLYDQRGHGKSGLPPAPSCTIDQLGRDLDAVIRSVAPEGPLVLVGHSMGGMTIMALADQRPELFGDRVRGVVLMGTSAGEVGRRGLPRPVLSRYNPVTRTVGEVASWQPELVEWVRQASNGLTRPAVRRLSFGSSAVPPSLVRFMIRMLRVTPVSVLTNFLPTLNTHDRYAALAGLRHCEVVLISGDHDRITPYQHTERIAAELPSATEIKVEDAGHMVMLERPDVVNAELAELLRRCAKNFLGLRRWRK